MSFNVSNSNNLPNFEDMVEVNYNPQELYDVLLDLTRRIEKLELKIIEISDNS